MRRCALTIDAPLELPCGGVLKNRFAKSAMSDSLGDGRGGPTAAQGRLYERWAEGGAALSIIGEVQGTALYPEKPGNLVLGPLSDMQAFGALARRGSVQNAQLWMQLGHAGAMSDPLLSEAKGPSALELPGLTCGALTLGEIKALPAEFARTARLAKACGFGGVQVHGAHGFLLSQFLSPLFNKRTDGYGGALNNRMRLLVEVIEAVRAAVGSDYPVGLELNATDQLDGGFEPQEALEVMAALEGKGIDLIDISGGTYFPGAPSSSDRAASGPYFVDVAAQARSVTRCPLMVTGGFKTLAQVQDVLARGQADMIGLARGLVVDPDLPAKWINGAGTTPAFPRFDAPPEGGVTAWYTMQLTQIAQDAPDLSPDDLPKTIAAYDTRDAARRDVWKAHFGA